MEKFEEITSALDPRVKGRCKHKVSDIIIIAIATYLCGGDDYVSMYELCRERGEDLKPLVELPNGCPSVDTFERVISRIDPKAFGACLSVFGDTLIEDLKGKHVSIDGKRIRGSKSSYIRGHWGIENRLHWHLDVTFREDHCRARKEYAATNLNTIRKLALAIVSQQKYKLSLRKGLFKAALNIDYLKKLLKIWLKGQICSCGVL